MIAFRDVHKGFGAKRVLEGFSLEVPDGETTVIVGYSGSGKSVALKLIVGLLEPDFGAVEVDGAAVHQLDREGLTALRARIGFVFQFHQLLPEFTALENVMMPALISRQSLREAVPQAEALLKEVGLGARLSHKPGQLSGGNSSGSPSPGH